MKIACTFILCLAASLPLSNASAQVYQWKDGTGKTIISDSPPPTTKGGRVISAAPAADRAAVAIGTAPTTAAEKNMDFKKRQQETRQQAEKEAKEQLAEANRRENCERVRRQLITLESGDRLMTRDDQGNKRYLDDSERQQEIERARTIMTESCK